MRQENHEEQYKVPEGTKGDLTHAISRAGIGSIPVVGAAGVELFSLVIAPPIENRRNQWMDSVAKGLRALEEKVSGFKVEELSKNEGFISTVMHASQAAIRSHQQDKLEALRNAVLNVAIGRAPNEDVQLMFLNLVDSLTPWHIRILRFFQAPPRYLQQKGVNAEQWHMGGPSTVLEAYFPELKGHRDLYDLVVKDLYARGLFTIEHLHTTMSAHGMVSKRTTDLGDQFLAFIAPPA